VVIHQADVWWVDLPAPSGSEPGYRRPAVVTQGEVLNASEIATVLVVPCTSNVAWAGHAACAFLDAAATGLPRDSVAQAFLLTHVDRSHLVARVGRLSPAAFETVLQAVDAALGR
jgi:mRNA interferase MazF